MPKIIYFPVFGRAQGIRLLLKHKGIDFTEEVPGTGDCPAWAELKAQHPERGGLPWWVADDGKVYTQSVAILQALADEHGYRSDDPWVQFESNWAFECCNDFKEKPEFIIPFYKGAEATDEQRTATLELVCKLLDRLDARFADGRKYVAGDVITAADFYLAAIDCAYFSNPNGKVPEFN